MKLKDMVRRPRRNFEEFLQPETVKGILDAFDKTKGNGRTSEFKNVVIHNGHHLVFIRRAGGVVHGYRPEWIILDFADGAVTSDPSPALLRAAKRLEKVGLVETRVREYVLCAGPKDADFPPRNRHCRGRIYLKDGLDESGYEYRCPECEWPVFPERLRKRRHQELHTKVSRQGVESYISS